MLGSGMMVLGTPVAFGVTFEAHRHAKDRGFTTAAWLILAIQALGAVAALVAWVWF